ncbi:MAG: glycosyltransferase family 39 protein [Candidatus Sumerlaeota bacterium]|nr:glycosyltransferase family 39 protein [Candidatus Sumerlaeota bacterium]
MNASRRAGGNPMSFGLRLRNHPLAAILIVAAALRLGVFFFFATDARLFYEPDTPGYWNSALALLKQGTFLQSPDPGAAPETFRTPGYPAFMAGVFALFGQRAAAVILIQIALALATIYLTYWLAARAFHPYAGLWAAALVALDPTHIYHNNLLLTETLYAFLLVAGIYCLWKFTEDGNWALPALSGLLIAASVLARPFGVFVWVGVIIFLVVALARKPPRLIVALLVWGVAYGAPVGAWMLRNQKIAGAASVATIGGYNLLESRAASVRMLESGMSFEEAKNDLYRELQKLEQASQGKRWTEGQRQEEAAQLAKRIILEHPGLFAWAAVKSFFALHFGANAAFYQALFHRRTELGPLPAWEKPVFGIWAVAQWAALSAVYALGLIGLVWTWRSRSWKQFSLFLFLTLYPAVLLIGACTAHSRYRMSSDPYFAALAGAGIAAFAFRLRLRPRALPPLPKKVRTLVCIPVYNEKEKIKRLLDEFTFDAVDRVVLADDGSNDGTEDLIHQYPVEIIRHEVNMGVGAGIRDVINYGRRNGYHVIVVMAGNGKDDPKEIRQVMRPVIEEGAVYVQGSRFLERGYHENTPLFRWIAIQLYSAIFNLFSPHRCTDLTNGFRAYRLDFFDEPGVDIGQKWLERYELEYYIHFKAFVLGYPVAEVAVHKRYPAKTSKQRASYSKIRPFQDWWKMIRPMVYLFLRVKR